MAPIFSHRSRCCGSSPLLPAALVIVAMASIQVGSALAKQLFPLVGSTGAAALRLLIAAALLVGILRPWRIRLTSANWRSLTIYGLALGGMNSLFYAAIQRIPLGIAVALEVTGPLAVAVISSRRATDFLWIALALGGLLMLLPLGQALGQAASGVDLLGVSYALGAGASWALYILYGKSAGAEHGVQATAAAMVVGASVVLPFGIAQAGMALFTADVLPLAAAVAVLSTAFPYTLEMVALRRLPTKTFGTLTSLQPAFAAMSGMALLDERLTLMQWLAIGAIIAASVGTTATSVERPKPPSELTRSRKK